MLTVIGIFGCDEGLDGPEVTIQPIRHVFWLRKPRFGFGCLCYDTLFTFTFTLNFT